MCEHFINPSVVAQAPIGDHSNIFHDLIRQLVRAACTTTAPDGVLHDYRGGEQSVNAAVWAGERHKNSGAGYCVILGVVMRKRGMPEARGNILQPESRQIQKSLGERPRVN